MRFFLDTEFIDNGDGPVHLISLGLVAEDGREYYAVNQDCPFEMAGAWVREHVLPQMQPELARPGGQIRGEVGAFVNAGAGPPEFWACYAAYDWVLLCQLFGRPPDLPERWPRHCNDLIQLAAMLGNPPLPEQAEGLHHALYDARWNRLAWKHLASLAAEQFGWPG